MKSTIIPSIVRQARRRVGTPKSRIQANVAPPAAYQGTPRRFGYAKELVVAAVVVTVRVAVAVLAPLMLTGLVEPKLRVGGSCAPVGEEVTAAVNATLPVKPPRGFTLMVEVFPVAAPGATLTGVTVIVKPGGTGAVTVTDFVPDALL
jgi:hypothetical protein